MFKETIYDDIIFSKLENILGDPDKFHKSNKAYKDDIQNNLKKLTVFIECSSIFKKQINIISGTEEELKNFKEIFELSMNKNITRKNSSIFKNQLMLTILFIKNIIFKSYKTVNIDILFDKIGVDQIFYSVLVESSLNSIIFIPKNRENYNNEKLVDEVRENEIIKTSLHTKIVRNMIYYLSTILLNEEDSFIILEEVNINIEKVIRDSNSKFCFFR